jgi:hypothetical protein
VIAELSGVAALVVGLLMLVAVALLAFMVLVQPIWCIVDCAIDRKRSAGGKAFWIVILILLWGVANWFYGALAATGVALRTVTRAAWVLVLVLAGVFLFMFYGDAEFRGGIEREWQRRGPLITAGAPNLVR